MSDQAILSAALMAMLINASPSGEADAVLRRLLENIPPEELTSVPAQESHDSVALALGALSASSVGDFKGAKRCEEGCSDVANALDAICVRHVLRQAPRSRAICFTRIDDIRTQCLASCRE